MASLSSSILSPFLTNPEKIPNTRSNPCHLNPKKPISRKNLQKFSSIFFSPTSKSPSPKSPPLSCLTINQPLTAQPSSVWQKVQSLDFEFKSLTKPIDKVKRLLHYATILPPFNESSRTLENRVSGCTARVWLEANMDESGAMRFCLDSDSEITKGFCSCLIWALDGARPEDVAGVKTEDLLEMNVGLAGRVRSRVNPWQNVLFGMQRRTQDLVEEKECPKCLENVVVSYLLGVDGGFKETHIC